MSTINSLVTNTLQNILFCVNKKKESRTDLEQQKIQFFGWTVPLILEDSFGLVPNYD